MPRHGVSPAKRRRFSQLYTTDLSERLRVVCGDFSFAEFARWTGFNHETVRRYVQGESSPSPVFLAVLCDTFGYSPEWLLMGTGPERRRPASGRRVTRLNA